MHYHPCPSGAFAITRGSRQAPFLTPASPLLIVLRGMCIGRRQAVVQSDNVYGGNHCDRVCACLMRQENKSKKTENESYSIRSNEVYRNCLCHM